MQGAGGSGSVCLPLGAEDEPELILLDVAVVVLVEVCPHLQADRHAPQSQYVDSHVLGRAQTVGADAGPTIDVGAAARPWCLVGMVLAVLVRGDATQLLQS